jgi:Protein of unknown function (DUF2795)
MVQPHAGKRDYDLALGGIEFPASLSEIMKRARDVGGIDHEVHDVIGRLGQESYDSLEQLVQEIRDIYLADGIPADKLPL